MKVNPAIMHNLYKVGGVKTGTVIPERLEPASTEKIAAEKQDTITISTKGSFQRVLEKNLKQVMGTMEQPGYEARVQEIRAAVEDQSYYVPSEMLADSILNRMI